MATFYSSWVGGDDWRLRLEVTNSASNTECTYTAKLYWDNTYATPQGLSSKWSVTIDGTTKSGTLTLSGSGDRLLATVSKTVKRSTSKKTVKFAFSYKITGSSVSAYRAGASGSGSVSLAAKPSYKITYNANGGSGAPSSQTKWYGTAITLSKTKPTRTGHKFNGWAKSASGSVAYQPGDTYSTNAALSLYANWTINTYKVTFNANGGTGGPESQTKTYGKNLTISSTKPTRTNYNFLGWGTSANSTTVAYKPGGTYSSNAAITLYAIWELAWIEPQVTNFRAARCDSSGVLNDEGTYAKISFGWKTDRDVKSISIECNSITTPIEATGTSGSVSNIIIGNGALSIENLYAVTLHISDINDGISITTTIPSMKFVMDVAPNGSVSFGKPADSSIKKFEVITDRFELSAENRDLVMSYDTNHRPKFHNHVGLANDKWLQGELSSNKGYANLIRMNADDQVEMNWTKLGIQGRMFKKLWSGDVNIEGKIVLPEHWYYRLFVLYVESWSTRLWGIRSPNSETYVRFSAGYDNGTTMYQYQVAFNIEGTSWKLIGASQYKLSTNSRSEAPTGMLIYGVL